MKEAERAFLGFGKGFPVGHCGYKQAVCPHDIGLNEFLGAIDGSVHVGFGSQVEDSRRAVFHKNPMHELDVADVPLDEPVRRMGFGVQKGVAVAGVSQLVEVDHGIALFKGQFDEVAADESASPGKQYFAH